MCFSQNVDYYLKYKMHLALLVIYNIDFAQNINSKVRVAKFSQILLWEMYGTTKEIARW